jgi:carboxyl-terminal processing protease
LDALEAARQAVEDNMAYPLGGGAHIGSAFGFARPSPPDAADPNATLRVLEAFVFGLGDHHVSLDTNSRNSPRLVPTAATVWAEARPEGVIVTAVRQGSPARTAGLREGMRILTINGRTPETLQRPPSALGYEAEALGFAARVEMAGTHAQDAQVVSLGPNGLVSAVLSRSAEQAEGLVALTWPAPGVAHLRLNNSLGDDGLPAAFDAAMEEARAAGVILLDLRDTPSGGDSMIARPLMSWFVQGEQPYQTHERASGERWTETVVGRADAYRGRLLVLVDRWTGSMGEGTAIGLRAAAGATLIGSPMAGLRGAMGSFPLPCLGAALRLPVERLYEVAGGPREHARPDILVTEAQLAAAGLEDAILRLALHEAARP